MQNTETRIKILQRLVQKGMDFNGKFQRLLDGLRNDHDGVVVQSQSPPPASAKQLPVTVVNPAGSKRHTLSARPLPCVELGKCPTGHRCSEGFRTCGLGFTQDGCPEGSVKHDGLCQACDSYVRKTQ